MNNEKLIHFLQNLVEDTPVKVVADKFITSARKVILEADKLGLSVQDGVITIKTAYKPHIDCTRIDFPHKQPVQVKLAYNCLWVLDESDNQLKFTTYSRTCNTAADINKLIGSMIESEQWVVKAWKLMKGCEFTKEELDYPFQNYEYDFEKNVDVLREVELLAA